MLIDPNDFVFLVLKALDCFGAWFPVVPKPLASVGSARAGSAFPLMRGLGGPWATSVS